MRINPGPRLCPALALAALLTGCAAHKPVTANWRYARRGAEQVLVPPDVASPALVRRTVAVKRAKVARSCPSAVQVDAVSLAGSPQGWLTTWTSGLESRGCIAIGEGPALAVRMAEALPLDPVVAWRVLYPNELAPPQQLQVVSPILRDAAGPLFVDAGNSVGLDVTVKSTDNLIGYETAVYAVRPRAAGGGNSLVPLYADRHVQQKVERVAQPATNYFPFAPGGFATDVAFYRVFVKSGQTEFTALVLGAPTWAELDSEATSCEALPAGRCIAIPRNVAINPVVPVTINGVEVPVRWGGNLGEALRTSGAAQPESLAGRLSVSRLYKGKLIPIDFDRSSPAILRLPINGGEVISWDRK